jgi:type IV secretory pathway VirB2 component (pilin)
MKMAFAQIKRFLIVAMAAAAVALQPASSWAATATELPWDQPLEALQEALIGPVAHSLIAMSFIGAVFAYAIAGDSEIARRLAKAGLGVSVGLVLPRLMNYLVP